MAGADALRSQLASTVASAAGPYGYTIALGGSTLLARTRLGSPHLGSVLLVMVGAVVAFVTLEVSARGSLVPGEVERDRPPSVWGNAHILSAGAAICASWGVVHILDGALGWLVTGFVATLLFFVLSALQRIAIDHLAGR